MSIVKRIIGFGIVLATCILCGCETQECGECQDVTFCRPSSERFGAFSDEIYVWETYQFTTNRVEDVK